MMNLESVTERINRLGYRKSTGISYTDEGLRIIDYHKKGKGIDMYTAYVNAYGSVEYVEKTKFKWDNSGRRYPVVSKYHKLTEIQ